MLNSIHEQSSEEQDYISTMPFEVLKNICDRLEQEDRLNLARMCQRLFDFINAFYLNTTYGKMFAFVKFANEELKEITKNINLFKKTNEYSLSYQKGRANKYTWIFRIMLVLYVMHSAVSVFFLRHNTTLGQLTLLMMALKFTVLFCGSNFRVHEYNTYLLHDSIDDTTEALLNELLQDNPLLQIFIDMDSDDLRVGSHKTNRDANLAPDEAKEKMASALQTFGIYHASLRGSKIKEIDLAKITESEEGQDFLRNLLEDYKDQTSDVDKHVKYQAF